MNKRIMMGVAAALAAVSCVGCAVPRLADPDSAPQTEEKDNPPRLAGVYITTEPINLFDMEAYIEEKLSTALNGGTVSPEDAEKYGGKICAEVVEKTFTEDGETVTTYDYTFPGLEGKGMLLGSFTKEIDGVPCTFFEGDEGISDIRTHLDTADEGETTVQEAVIYQVGEQIVYYFNPVYQTEDGTVYLTEGQGVHVASGLGGTMTNTLAETTTVTKDGEEKTEASEIKVTVEVVELPRSVTLFQMAADHSVLSETTLDPDALPDPLTLSEKTAYVLIEEDCGGKINRRLVQEGDDTPYVFRSLGNGICVKAFVRLVWSVGEGE